MADYTLSTSNARQDAALALAAARKRATVDEYVRAQFARIVQKAIADYDKDIADRLPAFYLAASPAKQAQAKAALGFDA